MTIVEAVKDVLSSGEPMSSKDIYEEIIKRKSYEFSSKNPQAIVNAMIRRHCLQFTFPTSSPVKYFSIAYKEGKRLKYTLLDESQKVKIGSDVVGQNEKEMLPEEKLLKTYNEHLKEMYNMLLEAILEKHPSFFEQLVVDLLLKMGYGYDSDSGITVGGPHDGGIDGIINEDKLGFDLIYLQAKRYKPTQKIGIHDVEAFSGAMDRNNVKKGVFITTSSFTPDARNYFMDNKVKKIKPIDGELLVKLMIEHGVGVKVSQSFNIYKIDTSYFE